MVEVVVPSPGESITEVTLGTWRKSDGDWVEKDELLNEIDSDKATLELLSPASGAIRLVVKSGTEQKVGTLVANIDEAAARPAGAVAAKSTKAAAAVVGTPAAKVATDSPTRISGVAKKMAADKGIDAGALEGSGPSGRVMKVDIEGAAKSGSAAHVQTAMPGTRGIRREKMTRLRQRIAERLVSAQHNAAMLTTFNEVDMSEVIRLRTEHKADFEKTHGVGLGFMGFFIRSCVSALQHYPRANAYLAGDEMEFHDYVDVGVAVGTERGQ